MYDISVPIRPGMAVWADEVPVELEPVLSVKDDGAAVSRLCLGTHTGTHIDPPSHFIESGAAAHELPLDAMRGGSETEYNMARLPLKLQGGDGAPARAILLPLA